MANELFGIDKLVADATNDLDAVLRQYDFQMRDHDPAGSPIERLLSLAIETHCAVWPLFRFERVNESAERAWSEINPGYDMLLLRPQVSLSLPYEKTWRVDFLLTYFRAVEHQTGWRQVVVECDGHDFHERTKDQAAHDRSNDRAAVQAGYPVLRFTGSEIWRDPWGCAGEVISFLGQPPK